MVALPTALQDYLRDACIEAHHPAFLRVARDGRLIETGGDLERYGLGGLAVGSTLADCVDVCAGLIPLRGRKEFLPLVAMGPEIHASIHGIPGEGEDWVLLLDACAEAAHQARFQQAMNNMALLKDEQSRLLDLLRKDREDLETILDQMRVVTLALADDGRVEFVSRSAELLLGRTRARMVGKPWAGALSIDDEGRRAIESALTACTTQRTPLRVPAGGGTARRMDFDVQPDPRGAGRRLLFLYDVTDACDLRSMLDERNRFEDLVGKSGPMKRVFDMIRRLAPLDATVLIEGDTGTGKELVARALHFTSHRKDKAFIIVNCAGLSDSLINSELFGHRKGAFTGADQDQVGLFEAADGGTILLDEIGDVPMNTQTRLLRVLEEREVVRIGETRPRKIDIRILAATNRDLAEEVRRGRFREDLLYRVRVARVALPALRERREDVPLLVDEFLHKSRASTGKPVGSVDGDAMRRLLEYPWPGNVRELRNAVEYAVISARGCAVLTSDLPPEIRERPTSAAEPPAHGAGDKTAILKALEEAGGNRERAAASLGLSRATFYRRLKPLLAT